MPRVIKREATKRDLTAHFIYLAEHAGFAVARRFKLAARRTFADLSKAPLMGAPGRVLHGKFADVRLWRVRGFDHYLIAYRALADGVLIERVVHSALDFQRVLK